MKRQPAVNQGIKSSLGQVYRCDLDLSWTDVLSTFLSRSYVMMTVEQMRIAIEWQEDQDQFRAEAREIASKYGISLKKAMQGLSQLRKDMEDMVI